MKPIWLLLLPLQVSAQVYNYTSEPITYSNSISYAPDLQASPAPLVGTQITGVITLAAPLPANGTTTVTPISMSFTIQSADGCCYSFVTDASTSEAEVGNNGSISTLTATTDNGVIISFSFESGWPNRLTSEIVQAGSGTVAFSMGSPAGAVNVIASEGTLVDPPSEAPSTETATPATGGSGSLDVVTLLLLACALYGRLHLKHNLVSAF